MGARALRFNTVDGGHLQFEPDHENKNWIEFLVLKLVMFNYSHVFFVQNSKKVMRDLILHAN